MVTKDNFTKVNSDINGNPRYVIHFLDLLTTEEQNEIHAKARPFKGVSDCYDYAAQKAKQIGGKRYNGKDYGGGIVFQSYNITDTANKINKLLKTK